METKTAEPIVAAEVLDDEKGSYLALVEQIGPLDSAEVIAERQRRSEEMASAPEEYLVRQFEDLSELYRARSVNMQYHWRRKMEEVSMFVSRTSDQTAIDEKYIVVDTLSYGLKTGRHTDYAVKISRENTPDRTITYDGETVRVLTLDEQRGDWRDETQSYARRQILEDFFYESLRATAIQINRPPADQIAADADAKAKLRDSLQLNKRHDSPLE